MMRDIDLNQFWPPYSPVPPRLPVAHQAVPAETQLEGELLYAPIAAPDAPDPAVATARLDREAAIEEALAAASASWVQHNERPEANTPAPPPETGPAQLLLDLPGWDAHTSDMPPPLRDPVGTAVTATPPTVDAPAVPAPVRDTPPLARKRRDFTPVVWGGAGFIAGVLAWHMVGFWMFISDVVLNANDPRARTLEAFLPSLSTPAASQKAMSRIPESAVVAAPQALKSATAGTQFACVSLALDRTAGSTNAQACNGSTADLRDAGFNRRTDRLALRPRLQDPVAWTDTTAVQVSEADPSISADKEDIPPLADADLKLDID